MSEQTKTVILTTNALDQSPLGGGRYNTIRTRVTIDDANPQSPPTISIVRPGFDNDIPIGTWDTSTNRWTPLNNNDITPTTTIADIRRGNDGLTLSGLQLYDNTSIAELLATQGNGNALDQNTIALLQDHVTDQELKNQFSANYHPYQQRLLQENQLASSEEINVTIADTPGVVRTDYGDTVYPISMEGTTQDRLEITMYRYAGRTIGGDSVGTNLSANNFTLGTRSFTERLGSVQLPIHPGIRDNNGVDWGGASLNPFQAYLATAAMGVMGAENPNKAIELAGKGASQALRTALNDPAAEKAMTLWFAQKAVGAQNLLSRASGAIVNPNLELLFNGPLLRDFTFNFRLSARTQDESINIRRIIRFFKQGGSVKSGGSEGLRGVFLKAPNVFKIRYLTYKSGSPVDHPSINRIKMAALLGCEVDYTPDNTYMTYDDFDQDHPMTSYNLGLRFSELTPILEDDYVYTTDMGEETESNLAPNSIGY